MSVWFRGPASRNSASTWSASTRTPSKIERLKRGEMPIYEPGLDQLVETNVRAGRLSFSTDLPRRSPGRCRLHRRRHALAARRRPCRSQLCLRRGRGNRRGAERLCRHRDEVDRAGRHRPQGRGDHPQGARPNGSFDVVSNPEFLREGSAIEDFMRPDRVVIGTESERAREIMRDALPAALSSSRRRCCSPRSRPPSSQIRGEHLPRHQDHLHQRDRRSLREGRRRRPGRRQGHRPRRPHRAQVPACRRRLWRLVLPQGLPGAGPHRAGGERAARRSSRPWCEVNDERKARMADKVIAACGGSVKGKTLAVLGLTFKPNTDDMRDSPSLAIVPALQKAGATDPRLRPRGHGTRRRSCCPTSPTAPIPTRRWRAPTRSSSSPNGTSSAPSISSASRGCCARRRSSTCATSTSRPTWRRPASSISASGAPRLDDRPHIAQSRMRNDR